MTDGSYFARRRRFHMLARFKRFKAKYPYYWVSLYFVFYMIWFAWVESRANLPYHVIHFPLDDYIPFCEYFVVPYILWFGYIAVVYLWLFFHDKSAFFKYIAVIYTGMTLFLIISTIYPNGHLLRPTEFSRNNIFIRLVCFIYWADTSTNILPSIHVFNSIAAHVAVMNAPELKNKKWTVRGSLILCVSIILSTMFIKQHSCIDVMLGILLGILMNYAVYRTSFLVKAHDFIGKLVRENRDLSPSLSRDVHSTAKDAEI